MPTCRLDGCANPAAGRGLCRTHWARWSKVGKPDLEAWLALGGRPLRHCAVCKKPYGAVRGRVCCSPECEAARFPEGECVACGRTFRPKGPGRSCCSPSCSGKRPRRTALPRNVPASARLIRKRRLELGLTQRALADALGVTKQLYSTIERGRMPLRQDDGDRPGPRDSAYRARAAYARKIARVLKLRPADLLSDRP